MFAPAAAAVVTLVESYTVTSEVAHVSFLPEVVAQIWLDPSGGFWGCWATFIKKFFQ